MATRKRPNKKGLLQSPGLIMGALILVLLLPAGFMLAQNNSFTPVLPDPVEYPSPDRLTIGSPEASLVLEEYSDFQCPACKRFHDSIFPVLLSDYIEPGHIAFTYQPLPILDSRGGNDSQKAAEAALCAADQDSFWPYHDVLFANQGEINSGRYSENNLVAMANALGLDEKAFSDCLSSDTYSSEVQDMLVDGLGRGIQATPTLVLNGEILEFSTYGELQQILDEAVAQN